MQGKRFSMAEDKTQHNPKRRAKRLSMEARQRSVAMLLLSGVTSQTRICAELKASRATISKDVAAIEKLWREETVQDVADAKAVDLARIDELIRATLPLAKSGNLNAVEKMTGLLKRRADIYGYDAPKVMNARLTGRDGGPIRMQHTIRDMSIFTDEEVFALANVAERVKMQAGDLPAPALPAGDDAAGDDAA
jgi:DNA-binding CsgD family transcriptional regulator